MPDFPDWLGPSCSTILVSVRRTCWPCCCRKRQDLVQHHLDNSADGVDAIQGGSQAPPPGRVGKTKGASRRLNARWACDYGTNRSYDLAFQGKARGSPGADVRRADSDEPWMGPNFVSQTVDPSTCLRRVADSRQAGLTERLGNEKRGSANRNTSTRRRNRFLVPYWPRTPPSRHSCRRKCLCVKNSVLWSKQ